VLTGLLFTTLADAARAGRLNEAPSIGLHIYAETNLLFTLDLVNYEVELHTMQLPQDRKRMSLRDFVDTYFSTAEL
jgi:hypothetical protein